MLIPQDKDPQCHETLNNTGPHQWDQYHLFKSESTSFPPRETTDVFTSISLVSSKEVKNANDKNPPGLLYFKLKCI